MFLVKQGGLEREAKIRNLLEQEPAFAVLLSVIYFEWTVRRAIIGLGKSSNVEVRKKLRNCHGTDEYKNIWKEEVSAKTDLRLPQVVRNWDGLLRAFSLRHRLVHGVTACGYAYAKERMNWALQATADVRSLCEKHDINLDARLPVRRLPKVVTEVKQQSALQDGNRKPNLKYNR